MFDDIEQYLRTNAPQRYNWIMYYDKNIHRELKILLNTDTLVINAIYFTFIDSLNKKVLSLLNINNGIYLFKEHNQDRKLISLSCEKELFNNLTGPECNMLCINLKKYIKSTLRTKSINSIKSIKSIKYKINPIIDFKDFKDVETLSFVQNFNFDFKAHIELECFKNIKLLEFTQMPNLTNDIVKLLTLNTPLLEVINIHECPNINIIALKHLLEHNNINKININDFNLWCGASNENQFVTQNEWQSLPVNKLQQLSLNSKHITTDILDYIIKKSNHLEVLILNDTVYSNCMKNLIPGESIDRFLSFIKWSDIDNKAGKGTLVKWQPTFRNMFKDIKLYISQSIWNKVKEL